MSCLDNCFDNKILMYSLKNEYHKNTIDQILLDKLAVPMGSNLSTENYNLNTPKYVNN